MGRRKTTEGSWDDNAKNQHFMYSSWRFLYWGYFQRVAIGAKKAYRTHIEGRHWADTNLRPPNEEVKEGVLDKDTLGLFA